MSEQKKILLFIGAFFTVLGILFIPFGIKYKDEIRKDRRCIQDGDIFMNSGRSGLFYGSPNQYQFILRDGKILLRGDVCEQ